jgi:ABC-type Zn2+ transport system substrate-binding protein/surface adhesin
MNRICICILIIGQVLALSAWASVPVLIGHSFEGGSEYSTESPHLHLDQHVDQHSHVTTDDNHDNDHEHDESCHLHLSVQVFSSPIHEQQTIIKSIQNAYLGTHLGRQLNGPPTPPPTI